MNGVSKRVIEVLENIKALKGTKYAMVLGTLVMQKVVDSALHVVSCPAFHQHEPRMVAQFEAQVRTLCVIGGLDIEEVAKDLLTCMKIIQEDVNAKLSEGAAQQAQAK